MNNIQKRIQNLINWIRENQPEIVEEQKHLDSNSEARAYWHYGYLMALKDVQDSLLKE